MFVPVFPPAAGSFFHASHHSTLPAAVKGQWRICPPREENVRAGGVQHRGGLGQSRGTLMHQRVRPLEQRVERAEAHIVAVATVISNVISALWLYPRGFGVSFAPAALTMLGVCGVRIASVRFVFPPYRTFASRPSGRAQMQKA